MAAGRRCGTRTSHVARRPRRFANRAAMSTIATVADSRPGGNRDRLPRTWVAQEPSSCSAIAHAALTSASTTHGSGAMFPISTEKLRVRKRCGFSGVDRRSVTLPTICPSRLARASVNLSAFASARRKAPGPRCFAWTIASTRSPSAHDDSVACSARASPERGSSASRHAARRASSDATARPRTGRKRAMPGAPALSALCSRRRRGERPRRRQPRSRRGRDRTTSRGRPARTCPRR